MAFIMLGLVSIAPAGFTFADDAPPQDTGSAAESSDANLLADSSITTGDAVAGTDVTNTVNTNTVDIGTSDSNEDGQAEDLSVGDASTESSTPEVIENVAGDSASSTPEEIIGKVSTSTLETLTEEDNTATTTLSLENENTATSTSSATSTAETGENEASTDDGMASVDTGDSYAFANVANTINSNFVDSNGSFQLLNLFGNIFGDLSLSMEDGAGCSFLCFLTQLFVQNFNTTYLENNISVSASSGANTATSTNGDAGIATGNAFAAANVINMVNTNVVGADYLAFIMNTFGSWEGDLVLPPGSFWDENAACCFGGNITTESENNAAIENNMNTEANSGDNAAEGGSSALVETGDAGSLSNVMTIANTNIFGNNLLLMYVRTGGSWLGHVFSLPDGVRIIGTGDGFIIDGFTSRIATSRGAGGVGSTTISNINDAHITNNVSASALTGGNAAFAGGNAAISTGNAYAAANVVNIVNTNIIGRNWLFAIINIFGNWNGDLAFGRPDLWVGASAEGPSPLQDGATPRFTVTYRNNGNAPATESEISFNFGSNLNVTDTGGGRVEDNTISWDAGTINPGQFGSFSFAAEVQDVPTGDSQVSVIAVADMFEDDGNTSNNTDELKLDYYKKPSEGFLGYSQIYARLEIAKERKGPEVVHTGDDVNYVITIQNKGAGYAYNVRVDDNIMNANGDIISTNGWDLDTVYPGEKVVIEYTVQFAKNTPPGTYMNYALAKWYDEVGNYVDHSGHKSASVEIVENPNILSSGLTENASTTPDGSLEDVNGVGGDGDMASTSEDVVVAGVNDEDVANTAFHTVAVPADHLGGYEGGDEADDILVGENPVYVTDARPLDTSLRNELARSHRNPWDPRNLFANIALSSIGYSMLWAFLAATVVYLVSRKRGREEA